MEDQHSTGFMLKRDLGSTSQKIVVIGDAGLYGQWIDGKAH